MRKTLLITIATAAGLLLSVAAVQAQRTDTDVDEGFISTPGKQGNPARQGTTTRTRNSPNQNPQARAGSKTGSDCQPAGSRRCKSTGSR
jgi:hypothetical protein